MPKIEFPVGFGDRRFQVWHFEVSHSVLLLRSTLTENPPAGAEVTFEASPFISRGWNAHGLAPWLEETVRRAAQSAFGRDLQLGVRRGQARDELWVDPHP